MKLKSRNKHIAHINGVIISMLVAIVLCMLLIFPKVSFEYMRSALKLCIHNLVPSLFPFMVISDFLILSNAGRLLFKVLCFPIKLIFGLSTDGAFAVLMGFVCGFPVGAKSALQLYDQGRISQEELRHIMGFCNIPSPAFVCGSVGVMFGNRTLGVVLFISVLLSSALMGITGRFIYKYEHCKCPEKKLRPDVINSFTRAVSSSASVMLTVCAYVTFFSVVIGYLNAILSHANLSETAKIFICGLLEISNGVSATIGTPPDIAPILASFFLGFSGISVMLQILSLDTDGHINKKAFALQKSACGILSAITTYMILKLFDIGMGTSTQTSAGKYFGEHGTLICILFFACSILPLIHAIRIFSSHNDRHIKKID
ncbi:MAG: hypothetical protein E7667_00330 [Ruminococcaceae bacterium]|nr:hypothetical protein [Oscillospiraceae bacterium]